MRSYRYRYVFFIFCTGIGKREKTNFYADRVRIFTAKIKLNLTFQFCVKITKTKR
jgi:hypothetical protein